MPSLTHPPDLAYLHADGCHSLTHSGPLTAQLSHSPVGRYSPARESPEFLTRPIPSPWSCMRWQMFILAWHALLVVSALAGRGCSLEKPCVAHTLPWLLCTQAGVKAWPNLTHLQTWLTHASGYCSPVWPHLPPALTLMLICEGCSPEGEFPKFSYQTHSQSQISCIATGATALPSLAQPPTSPRSHECQVSAMVLSG